MRKISEQSERKRLLALYAGLPPKKLAIADGLIAQAARLRVRLDQLWADIQENEKTEPYERERPAARLFTSTDKNYQSIIKQLNDMLPADDGSDTGFDVS